METPEEYLKNNLWVLADDWSTEDVVDVMQGYSKDQLKEIKDKMFKEKRFHLSVWQEGYNQGIDEAIEILNQYIKDGE